jgi:hypothetical protein
MLDIRACSAEAILVSGGTTGPSTHEKRNRKEKVVIDLSSDDVVPCEISKTGKEDSHEPLMDSTRSTGLIFLQLYIHFSFIFVCKVPKICFTVSIPKSYIFVSTLC